MKNAIRLSMLLTFAVSGASPSFPQNVPAGAPDVGGPEALWRNPAKSPDERAKDLLPRLTLEEKISLLHGAGTFHTPGLPRFGIDRLWFSDGPNGVREEHQLNTWSSANRNDDHATALPACVGLAASFDPDLAKSYGSVIGQEARVRNKHIMLAPGLNIMRTPLNGRNSEYFGEDPYLAARIAVGYINGIQQHGVAACAKHYALNNQETNRNSVNAKVDERTMREIYLPAFKAAVVEAKVLTIMTAYNRINGYYASENDFLLNQVLKSEWGFQGLVMSDWGGTHSTVNAAKTGSDLEMGSNVGGNHNNDFFARLPTVIGNGEGQVPMSRVDDMALRNLRVMAATGLFDKPRELTAQQKEDWGLMSPAHLATARSIVESSCVLLKNHNSLLPLDQTTLKSVAVIGDVAQARFAHDGMSAGIKTRDEVTVLQGIQRYLGDKVPVTFAQGYAPAGGRGGMGRRGAAPGGAPDNTARITDAVNAAKAADVAIVVAGLYRAQDQEAADRPSFELPAGQSELIQAVCAANPRTIVILTGGSPSNVNPWIDQCGAFMMYWYGGSEGGNGLARLLFGDANPSGRLPCSWPKALSDSPAHANNDSNSYPGTGGGRGAAGRGVLAPDSGPQQTYAEGLLVGYRWFDARNIEPQFPFGFGLSYTTFALSDVNAIMVARERVAGASPRLADAVVSVNATVTNTGPRDGAQVVQVYVEQAQPSLARPPRELKGFAKVAVPRGQRATVTIPLDLSSFAFFDPQRKAWVAEAGEFAILVGDSSRNTPLKATIRLPETITLKEGQ